MAEDDAEKAFFEAQAMSADSVDFGKTVKEQGADSSDDYDYDPSKTLQDEYSASLTDSKQSENVSSNDPSPSDSNPPQQTSFPPKMDPSQPGSDTVSSQTPPQSESRISASAPQPKAKTIGGFVVDDEDEDEDEDKGGDEEYEPPGLLGVEGNVDTTSVNVPQQSVSGNTNQSTSIPDVSFPDTGQESANAQTVSNSPYFLSSAAVPAPSNETPTVLDQNTSQSDSAQASAAPTPTPESPAASRGRLPHDRVGILEDRIHEDPRGDIPAWIELINEHKARSRIDSTREVYERFLKVFPFAVSTSFATYSHRSIGLIVC